MRFIIIVTLILFTFSTSADVIQFSGERGINGVDGGFGDPGEDGTSGTDGESVVFDITFEQSANNQVQIYGGQGGTAGDGGDGVDGSDVDPSANGGSGGNGGNGGDVSATVRTVVTDANSASIFHRAFGAEGRRGGLSGNGFGGGIDGTGGQGGEGGNAVATSIFDNQTGSSMFFYATVEALGASSGRTYIGDGFDGGDAEANIVVVSQHTESIDFYVDAEGGDGATSFAGNGGNGGAALSSVTEILDPLTSSDANANLDVTRRALGGDGGAAFGVNNRGGDGGVANSEVSLLQTASSYSQLVTRVVGGSGGNGVQGADGGDGADAELDNVAQDTTGGFMQLYQSATGGDGGSSDLGIAGIGGSARSVLHRENTDSWILQLGVYAHGGAGGRSDHGVAEHGAQAFAEVSGIESGQVRISASVTGGDGGGTIDGIAGDGVSGTLGDVIAISTDSYASVTGESTGGRGGDAYGAGQGGAGADAYLSNALTAQSAMSIHMTQRVRGGDGGSAGGGGTAGVGGDGFSELYQVAENEDVLSIYSIAGGGTGGAGAAAGGDAIALATSENAQGDAYATAESHGGHGGHSGSVEANGGNGFSRAVADASNGGLVARAIARAYSGSGGNGNGGNAGDATAEAIATGSGLGETEADAFARAEDDASSTSDSVVGGNASAHAEARNQGSEDVDATAFAEGGDVGYTGDSITNAHATAFGASFGDGEVRVTATQTSGNVLNYTEGVSDGLRSTMVDAVDGHTSGRLFLTQIAVAGDARFDGTGGLATSTLTRNDLVASQSSLRVEATGGNGGEAFTIAGAGGAAHARVFGQGLNAVNTVAIADGGDSGESGNPNSFTQNGGDAFALSEGISLNNRGGAFASATAGRGLNGVGDGTATARSIAHSGGANSAEARSEALGKEVDVFAQASLSHGNVDFLSANYRTNVATEGAAIDLLVVARTNLTTGSVPLGVSNSVRATGLPVASIFNDVFFQNPDIADEFSNSAILLYSNFGAYVPVGEDIENMSVSSSTELSISAEHYINRNLIIGLLGPTFLEGGFSELSFQILEEETTLLQMTFFEVADALVFFEEGVLNLGSWFSSSSDGSIDLTINISAILDNPGDALGFGVLVGVQAVPIPAGFILFLSAFAFFIRKSTTTCS